MKKFKKGYRKLYNYYKNQLKLVTNLSCEVPLDYVNYIVTYLMFLRDRYIATSNKSDFTDDTYMNCLCYTLSEFDAMNHCLEHYFNELGEVIYLNDTGETLTREQVTELWRQEYQAHSNNFWDALKCGREIWFQDENIL